MKILDLLSYYLPRHRCVRYINRRYYLGFSCRKIEEEVSEGARNKLYQVLERSYVQNIESIEDELRKRKK